MVIPSDIQNVGATASVRTDDGSVIPINEVDFGDLGNKAIYETAADFADASNANRFLQIYQQSGFDPADFLQLYMDIYMEGEQGGAQARGEQAVVTPGNGSGNGNGIAGKDGTGAQGNGPNALPQLPFDVQDVAPSGSLDLSGESLDAINALRVQSGLPPIEGGDWVYSDDPLAHDDECDIMDSADAQEEAGSGADGAGDPDSQTTEDAGEMYSPVNPGPLDDKTTSTFIGGSYTRRVLKEDTIFYRVYGGRAVKVGQYLSRTPQNGWLQSQLDLALKPEWGNTAEYVTKVTVPKGTIIYESTAAPQIINGGAGILPGGGNQVFIPEGELNPLWLGN